MMKQRLLTIVGIVICFSLGLVSSSMALSNQEQNFIDRLFQEAGITGSTNNDTKELKNLAKDEEAPFENLYLFMYENIKRGPHDAAIEDLALRLNYSEKQLEAIILESDTSKIIERKQERAAEAAAENAIEANKEEIDAYEDTMGLILAQIEGVVSEDVLADIEAIYGEYGPETLTTEDLSTAFSHQIIADEYTKIMDMYAEELERQRETRKLSYQSISKEIFMNGDLSDSANIDILYEFDLIHYLFFGEFMVMPDRSIPATERSISQVGSDATAIEDESETASNDEILLASELLPSPSVLRAISDEKVRRPDSFDAIDILLAEEEEDEALDPYACFDDEELRAALEAFELAPEEDNETDDPEDTQGETNSGQNSNTGSGSSYDYDPGDYNGEDEQAQALSQLSDFAGALGGDGADWSRSLPCGDVFCITVDLITENGDATQIQTSENHIFAHVSYINQRMEETMAKSLVPGKVSMNWFEDGTCKEAGLLVNLDLNIEAVPVPIDLDPGDDTDEYAAKDVASFQDELRIAAQQDPSYDCEAALALTDFDGLEGQTTIAEVLELCQEQEELYEQGLRELFDRFIFEVSVQSNSTLYDQMLAELSTFKTYIENFEAALKLSVNPLSNSYSKGYCQ